MLTGLVVNANANVLPGTMRLYWRDYDANPNDSRVTAAPGTSVFIQLMINSTSNQGNGKDFFLNADWDSSVVDTTAAPGQYVAVDTDMYMTFRDYQNPGGSSWNYTGVETISYGGSLDTLTIDFNGPGNLYPYQLTNGSDTGGTPIGETGTAGALTASEYFTTLGSGGVVAGFWVPIRADAVVGSTTRFDVNITSSGAWGGSGWHAALTEAGTEDWMDWQNATMWVDDGEGGSVEVPVGVDYSMVITVVPEPATMGLLAVGGIAALLRRRK
jgi:hypothetical protein